MTRRIDPSYLFRFRQADGRTVTRQVYYEALYAFYLREGLVLVAARPVPQSGMYHALYQLLQDDSAKSVVRGVLPQTAERPALPKAGSPPTDLVAKVAEVLPDGRSDLPAEFLEESERRAEAVVSQAMASYGIGSGLLQFDASEGLADIQIRGPKPAGALHFLAGTEDEDTAWVNLSFDVDRAVKGWIREHLEAEGPERALARYGDFEDDLYRRLYSNRRYLNFVRQVMNARGSYISPVVRDFVGFYAKCLNRKLEQVAEQEDADPDIVRKKLEGQFAGVKGRSHHYLSYHDLTILGRVDAAKLPKDEADPDMTETSHKVDPALDPGTILLHGIEGRWQRFIVRKSVQHIFNMHHNIQRVRYADEQEPEGRP